MTGTSTSATPAQAKPKRHQAQRACSNCKRLHARCDNERPCKRCTQNGLASTCMDIPRKRRMSRTYTEVWETRYNNGNSSSTTTHSVAVTNSPHIMTPNAWGTSPAIAAKSPMMMNKPMVSPQLPPQMMNNPNMGPGMVPLMGSSPYDPSLLLSEIVNPSDDHRHGYPEFGAMGPTGPLYEKQDPLVESFLYHQMHELSHIPSTPTQSPASLHHHHPHLQKSYSNTTPSTPSLHDLESEFNTSNVTGNMSNSGNISNNGNGNNSNGRMESGMTWNSIVPQQDFAISVWKGTHTPGLNYLVECNDRFLNLVGYNLDTLKNNFPCQKLFISKAFSSQKDWPKRTQIATAYGYKDVYLTIYPLIGDVSANKYFIVNMLELSPLPKMDNNITASLTYAPELKDTMNLKVPQSYDLNPNLKHEILRASSLQ